MTSRGRKPVRTAWRRVVGSAVVILASAVLAGALAAGSAAQAPGADLSVTSSEFPNQTMILLPYTYRLVVTNAGPGTATGVILTQNLNPQPLLSSASASQGTCSNPAGAIVCNLGSLAPGASAAADVQVTAPLLPTCVNSSVSASGGQTDPDLTNNSASLATEVGVLPPLLLGPCPGPAPGPGPGPTPPPGPSPRPSPRPTARPTPRPSPTRSPGPAPGPVGPTPSPSTSPGPPGPAPTPAPTGPVPRPAPTRSARVLPAIEGQTPGPPDGGGGGLPGPPLLDGIIGLVVLGSGAGLIAGGTTTRALLGVGRMRRGWRFGGDTSFASAPPAIQFHLALAAAAVLPQQQPAAARELLARRDAYGVPDGPEPYRHAALWSLALDRAVRARGGIGRKLLGVQKITVGFVEARRGRSRGRVQLAAICYVRRFALIQAAPLFVTVDGQRFPLVIRPTFRDRPARAPGGTQLHLATGMVTASVRLAGTSGILTAAHVAARDGDKRSVHENDTVSFSEPGQTPFERKVLRADAVMDAAVVEDDPPAPGAPGVHAYPFAGYFPVEMRGPDGSVVGGHVVEMEVPQGVVPGAPGQPPSDPAVLLIDVTGQPGWSGSMVWEATYREAPEYAPGPRPYAMFVGVRKVYTATLGRVHMLTQIEKVWELEIVEDGSEDLR